MFVKRLEFYEQRVILETLKRKAWEIVMTFSNSKTFGYCRVSNKDQNEDRQLEAMLNLGINERDIFLDKCSGKNFERPQYQALKLQLREGDVLVIKSIDRLGRNYKQICNEWREITKDIKANIKVINMPLLNTTRTD